MKSSTYLEKNCKTIKEQLRIAKIVLDRVKLIPEIKWAIETFK
jgi:hypothetical protein